MSEYNLRWHGSLTVGNIESVVKLFRQLLDGKCYTFVSINATQGYRPKVRTDQQVERDKATNGNAFNWWTEDAKTPFYAGFNVVDTYGVWGLSTRLNHDRNPYIVFEYNQVTIEHYNGFGEKLYWVIAVQETKPEVYA